MDIGDTIAPDSDQLDAIDLSHSGPRTFTITRVVIKGGEQPVEIHLREFDRPWRPGKSMRRVLFALWGATEGGAYEGRRVTLFCDDRVKFGGDTVGGVRISHMSHIGDRDRGVILIASRGKSGTFRVQPIIDPPEDAATQGEAAPSGEQPEPMTDKTRGRLFALLTEAGITDPEEQRARMSKLLRRKIGSRSELTETDGRRVITAVEKLVKSKPAPAAPEPEPENEPDPNFPPADGTEG